MPAEDLDQLIELLVGGLVVDEHPEPPVAVGHDLRRVDDRYYSVAPNIRTVHLALADVEGEGGTTEVVGGAVIECEVAWAHQLARAGLDKAALEAPRHRRLPPQIRSVHPGE